MSISQQLKERGIHLRGIKPGTIYATDCPKEFCQKERAGENTDCLKVEVISQTEAKWKCTNCLWSDKTGEPVQEATVQTAAPSTWQEYLNSVGVSDQAIERNKVKFNEERGAIEFVYKHEGKIEGATLWPINGNPPEYSSKKIPTLWGIHSIKDGASIIIAQNELDALILRAAGFGDVVAIPNGGNLPVQKREDDGFIYISHAADKLQAASRVTIATHNTPEGERLRHELVRRIGAAKCYTVDFAQKTPIETVRALGLDILCEDINNAIACPIAGLYEVADFQRDLANYFESGMASGVSTGWENLDNYYTVVGGQLTLITGMPNHGKSEFLDAMTLNIALNEGWRFAAYSPENGKEGHATKLIEKRVMMPTDPKAQNRMSQETFFDGASWVNKHYYFIAADSRKQAATIEWVLDRARDAVLRYGIKGLIIDPFNRLRRSKEAPEKVDEYVAYVLDLILSFAEMHDVHVWLVAHPRTMEADKKSRKYPVPNAYDIAGGANFANMADNILVIHRSEDIADATEVHVKKIRFKHVGKRTQIPPLLEYNAETGRFGVPEESTARYSVAEKEIQSIDA